MERERKKEKTKTRMTVSIPKQGLNSYTVKKNANLIGQHKICANFAGKPFFSATKQQLNGGKILHLCGCGLLQFSGKLLLNCLEHLSLISLCFPIIPYVNCFGRTVLYVCIEYYI